MTLRALRKANLAKQDPGGARWRRGPGFHLCEGAHTGRKIESVPKVILLDLKLPRSTAFEVLRRIKGDPRTRTIPVVILTSSKEQKDVVESYNLGVNSYITIICNTCFISSSCFRSWAPVQQQPIHSQLANGGDETFQNHS